VRQFLRAALVAAIGAVGVTVGRHNLEHGPVVVAVAVVLVAACVARRERGGAIGALGIGAAGAFASPEGLGPLLVLAGVVVACDVPLLDPRLAPWRDVIDGAVALPALAGLAGTVAAQPSHRGVVLGVAAGAAVVTSAWRGGGELRYVRGLPVVSGLGLLGAFAVALAPDRVTALGDLPAASVDAARSVAAGFALFTFVLVVLGVPRLRAAPRHRLSRP
jgi:hypothetical protein